MHLPGKRLWLQIVIAVLLTGAATGLVMRETWRDDSWTALRTFDARFLLAAALLVILAWIADMARLQAVCRALGYRVEPSTALRTNLLGYFLSAITPFTSGGGPLQVYSLTRAGVPVGHGTAVVLVSGFIAHLSLALAGIGLVFGTNVTISFHPGIDPWIRGGVLIYTGGVITLAFLVWHVDRARRFIRAVVRGVLRFATDAERVHAAAAAVDRVVVDLHNGLRKAARRRGWALLGFAAYFVYFLTMFATVPVLAAGLGGTPPFWAATAIQVPIFLFASVLPTPGGTGGLEFGLARALAPYLPTAQIGIVVATWRLLTFYAVVAVSGIAMLLFIRSELARVAGNGVTMGQSDSAVRRGGEGRPTGSVVHGEHSGNDEPAGGDEHGAQCGQGADQPASPAPATSDPVAAQTAQSRENR